MASPNRPYFAVLATLAAVSAAAGLGAAVVLVTFAALQMPPPPGLAWRSATFGAAATAGFAAGAGCGFLLAGGLGKVGGALARLLAGLAAGLTVTVAWMLVHSPSARRWFAVVPLLLALAAGSSWGASHLRRQGVSWLRAVLASLVALVLGIAVAISVGLAQHRRAALPGPPAAGHVRPP